MTRSHRRVVACLGILGLAFAQLAVTAHACMIRAAGPPAPAAIIAHGGHCAGLQDATAPEAPQGNACEVQCTDGAPSAAVHDLPPVALVALALPLTPATTPAEARAWGRSFLAANSAAPPRALQFCRLLI
jgi:hypothetical protein